MKIEQLHIDQIRIAFENMQSKEDLLQVLNEAKPLIYGEKAIPFELKQLTWYSNPKLARKRYKVFKIKKKSGSERTIHAPVKGLKALQKTLGFVIQCVYEPHKAAMGFVRDRSIVDNAKLHVGSKYVFNIDLKDFFPSIEQARVWKCLQLKPFNLFDINSNNVKDGIPVPKKLKVTYIDVHPTSKNIFVVFFDDESSANVSVKKSFQIEGEKILTLFCDENDFLLDSWHVKKIENTPWLLERKVGIENPINSRSKIANIIAGLCCTEMEVERINENGEWEKLKRNVLPQGAPTSPIITNIVCQRLDYLLTGVSKRFGLKYSRYADDITFSSMHNVYQSSSEFLMELHRIISEQGFHIKESKTRLQKDGYRKEVTGLLVNENVNVQLRYIKQLRMWLYFWKRYGYERAETFFLKQYIADKGHIKNTRPNMTNVISGKLDYLKMVKGADNKMYLMLKSNFDLLACKINPISEILNAWENNSIDEAMNIYYKKNTK